MSNIRLGATGDKLGEPFLIKLKIDLFDCYDSDFANDLVPGVSLPDHWRVCQYLSAAEDNLGDEMHRTRRGQWDESNLRFYYLTRLVRTHPQLNIS